MSINRRRGYIRATDQPDGALERWSLPHYEEMNREPKNTAMNYDPSWQPPAEEILDDNDAEPEIALSMLTADGLEQIRQSAVDEGMEEGRQLGHQEGHKTGFEQGHKAGFDEGKTAGFEQGLSEGQQHIDVQCQHLDQIIKKLAFPIEQIDNQVRQQVMQLVIQLAKAVMQTEIQTNEKIILKTLHETVNALPMADRKITVYLQPDDFNVVTSAHSDEALQERQWRLIAEPSLNRGDIQVASGDSQVDYKIEDRISQILARFSGQNPLPELSPPADGIGADVLIDTPKSAADEVADPLAESTSTSDVPDDLSNGASDIPSDISSDVSSDAPSAVLPEKEEIDVQPDSTLTEQNQHGLDGSVENTDENLDVTKANENAVNNNVESAGDNDEPAV